MLAFAQLGQQRFSDAAQSLRQAAELAGTMHDYCDLPLLFSALSQWATQAGQKEAAVTFAAGIHAQGRRTGYWVGAFGFKLFDQAENAVRARWPEAQHSDAWRLGETASVPQLLQLAQHTLAAA
jgi:hypothetical protein